MENNQTFETMLAFFKQHDFDVQVMESEQLIRLFFRGRNGSYLCFAKVVQECVIFRVVGQAAIPAATRINVAELFTRANYGLLVGNFQLDFSDGEIGFKIGIDIEETEFTIAMMSNLVSNGITMMDRFTPTIMSVVYGGVTPETALQEYRAKAAEPVASR